MGSLVPKVSSLSLEAPLPHHESHQETRGNHHITLPVLCPSWYLVPLSLYILEKIFSLLLLWRLEICLRQCHLPLNLPFRVTCNCLITTVTCLPILSFPVNVGPSAAAQSWVPTPFADLALIRNAANEYTPDSPYFEQVLRQWAMQLQTHYNW